MGMTVMGQLMGAFQSGSFGKPTARGTKASIVPSGTAAGTGRTVGGTPAAKIGKAGKLALIKTKRTGMLDEGTTSGRGKLLGN